MVAIAVFGAAGCDPGDIQVVEPESRGSEPALLVHAVLDTPQVALAAALGWQAGVPGATVRVHRPEEPYGEAYWTSSTTNEAGIASFPDLLSGLYEIAVTRTLTVDESAAAGGDVRVVAGGRRTHIGRGTSLDVAMEPNHAGSLVFSETALGVPLPWESNGTYLDGKYIELFNNSDHTVFLDGMLLGIGWHLIHDFPFWPCAQTTQVRDDPDGIWFRRIWRFPGAGTDFPVAPGATALIARAAVDHSGVHPSLVDLSGADFEFGAGYNNADNPDVADLEELSLAPAPPTWPEDEQPLFLSRPRSLEGLAGYIDPYSGERYLRMPRADIVDAVADVYDWANYSFEPAPMCLTAMNAVFERLPGPATVSGKQRPLGVQRRVLVVLPDGRAILQDTNTSMADFVWTDATPGWIDDAAGASTTGGS